MSWRNSVTEDPSTTPSYSQKYKQYKQFKQQQKVQPSPSRTRSSPQSADSGNKHRRRSTGVITKKSEPAVSPVLSPILSRSPNSRASNAHSSAAHTLTTPGASLGFLSSSPPSPTHEDMHHGHAQPLAISTTTWPSENKSSNNTCNAADYKSDTLLQVDVQLFMHSAHTDMRTERENVGDGEWSFVCSNSDKSSEAYYYWVVVNKDTNETELFQEFSSHDPEQEDATRSSDEEGGGNAVDRDDPSTSKASTTADSLFWLFYANSSTVAHCASLHHPRPQQQQQQEATMFGLCFTSVQEMHLFQNIRTSIVKILKIRHNHHTEKQKKVQQLQQQQQQQSSRPAAAATTTTANHIDLTPSLPAHSLPSALPLPSTLTYKSDSTLTCLLQLECETCHHLSSLAEYYSSLRYNMLSSPSLSSPPTPTQSTQISPVFVECMTMVKGETEDQPLFCYSNDTFLLPLPQQERNPLEIQVTISLMDASGVLWLQGFQLCASVTLAGKSPVQLPPNQLHTNDDLHGLDLTFTITVPQHVLPDFAGVSDEGVLVDVLVDSIVLYETASVLVDGAQQQQQKKKYLLQNPLTLSFLLLPSDSRPPTSTATTVTDTTTLLTHLGKLSLYWPPAFRKEQLCHSRNLAWLQQYDE